ncbi:O-antigen ligase family protein [Marinicrinis sediminis]|uniref:O-antigen ligase family protein n=1 Tax=Marinicrinis sediminis TaxID=1652465 RepID=A0ABW5RBD0_9BACL
MYRWIVLFVLLYPLMIYRYDDPLFYFTYHITGYDEIKSQYLWEFAALLCVVSSIRILMRKPLQPVDHSRVIWVLSGGFVLFVLLSSLFSVDPTLSLAGKSGRYEGLYTWASYLCLLVFSYYFIAVRHMNVILHAITWGSVPVCVYALLEHWHLIPLRNANAVYQSRSSAFFSNPNFLGTYLMIVFLIALYLLLKARKRSVMTLLYVLIIMQFVSMLYTYTRSAWIAACIGFLALSFSVWKRRSHIRRWTALSVLLLIALLAVQIWDPYPVLGRALSIAGEAGELLSENAGFAGSSRGYIWQETWPLIPNYAWLGSGPDTFHLVFPDDPVAKERYLGNASIVVDKAHHEWLHMIVTLGIPAWLIHMLLIFVPIFLILRTRKESAASPSYPLALILVLVILAYQLQAQMNISVVTVSPFTYILLGMLWRIALQQYPSPHMFCLWQGKRREPDTTAAASS